VSLRKWAIVAALFCLPACKQFYAQSQADASVNFAKYRTFSFSNSNSDAPEGFTSGHLFNSIMQRRIQAELYRDLTEKGFQQAARSDASFIISFSAGGRQEVQPLGAETGTTDAGNIRGAASSVSRGALVIHFIDPKTNQAIWRGWVEAVMQPDDDLDAKVRAAVREVMKQFPPSGA